MKDDDAFREFTVATVRYDTPVLARTSSIEEAATRLLRQLEDDGVFRKFNELYFLGHSMGGLLVKRILVDLNRPRQVEKLRRVKAVLYISTPAQGVNISDLGSWLSVNPQLRDMRPADLNSFLQGLENQWQDLIRDRGTQVFPQSFCAYETKPTHGVMVVNRIYAATSCDLNAFAVDEDHVDIVKPANRDSDIYKWVRARVQETTVLVARRGVWSTAGVKLESHGAKGTARQGESRISNYNRADILILAQDSVTGAGISSLAPTGHTGNADTLISFPAGWTLQTTLVPPGGCSLQPTGIYNDGKGGYRLSVMTRGATVPCPWLKGEYHFQLEINVNNYQGRSMGKIFID